MGRQLHELFKRLLSPIILPIADGPLAGCPWIVSSGSSFVRGRYEPEKTEAVLELVQPGDVVYDIGAHVGYFTVLFSREVGSDGRVFAFEPRDLNRGFLERHVSMNDCSNVSISNAAVGEGEGSARMNTRVGTGTGHLDAEGNVTVPLVSLDHLVYERGWPKPALLKIDVEGAEMRVLKGGRRAIEEARPRMILATHGDAIDAECHAFLETFGYSVEEIDQPKGDRELIVRPPANERSTLSDRD